MKSILVLLDLLDLVLQHQDWLVVLQDVRVLREGKHADMLMAGIPLITAGARTGLLLVIVRLLPLPPFSYDVIP